MSAIGGGLNTVIGNDTITAHLQKKPISLTVAGQQRPHRRLRRRTLAAPCQGLRNWRWNIGNSPHADRRELHK
jgi:hypothetical protein